MNSCEVVEYADEGATVKVAIADGGEIEGEVTNTTSVGESHIIHIGDVAVEGGVGHLVHAIPELVVPVVYLAKSVDSTAPRDHDNGRQPVTKSNGSLKLLGEARNVELVSDAPEGPEGPRGAV